MGSYTGIDNLEVMKEAENYNRFLVDLVTAQARPQDRIVDFGAGAGTFALPVTAAGHAVCCVENDAVLIERLHSLGLPVRSDLAQFDDASVDYLYSLNVLEHIADDAKVVDLWFRKLRPGGRVLVYVPAFDLLFSSMDRKVGHQRRYRLRGLSAILRASGFSIHTARYADSLGFLATLLFKLVGSDSGDIDRGALKFYDRVLFPISCALDVLVGAVVGKNVYVVAIKPEQAAGLAAQQMPPTGP
jgi:SAM-dependent methyltransferase